MTMMLSPQSRCGVKLGLCLPRSRVAISTASRPTTRPSASMRIQDFSMSLGVAENVFMVALSRLGWRLLTAVLFWVKPEGEISSKFLQLSVWYHDTIHEALRASVGSTDCT